MSAAGEEQLAALDAADAAQAERDRANRARYAEQRVRRAAAAHASRQAVPHARADVEAAHDAFSAAANARAAGTGSTVEVEAAWRRLDVARRELAAAQAVADHLSGP